MQPPFLHWPNCYQARRNWKSWQGLSYLTVTVTMMKYPPVTTGDFAKYPRSPQSSPHALDLQGFINREEPLPVFLEETPTDQPVGSWLSKYLPAGGVDSFSCSVLALFFLAFEVKLFFRFQQLGHLRNKPNFQSLGKDSVCYKTHTKKKVELENQIVKTCRQNAANASLAYCLPFRARRFRSRYVRSTIWNASVLCVALWYLML